MTTELKANLKTKIQEFLDENNDQIVYSCGIFLDDSRKKETAEVITNAAEAVIDGMDHQMKLNDRYQ